MVYVKNVPHSCSTEVHISEKCTKIEKCTKFMTQNALWLKPATTGPLSYIHVSTKRGFRSYPFLSPSWGRSYRVET